MDFLDDRMFENVCEVVQFNDASCQTDGYLLREFTSKTSLEVIPQLTKNQLQLEVQHLLDSGFPSSVRLTRQTDTRTMEALLTHVHTADVCTELGNVLSQFEKKHKDLTSSFSCLTQ